METSKPIMLSKYGKNKGKYVALVDAKHYDWLNQYNWCAFISYNNIYASSFINGRHTQMHRLIMNVVDSPNILIDHVNHNGLDNRMVNLRKATRSQNNINTRKRKEATSKYLGVSQDACGTYRAQIGFENKRIYIGMFRNEDCAALAYDIYSKYLYGEFASLNFPKNA